MAIFHKGNKKFTAAGSLAVLAIVATMMVLNPSIEREGRAHPFCDPALGEI